MTLQEFQNCPIGTPLKSSKNEHKYIKISSTQYRVTNGITGMPDDDPKFNGLKTALGYEGDLIGVYDVNYQDGLGLLYLEVDGPMARN